MEKKRREKGRRKGEDGDEVEMEMEMTSKVRWGWERGRREYAGESRGRREVGEILEVRRD